MKKFVLTLATFLVVILNAFAQNSELEKANFYLDLKQELTFQFQVKSSSEVAGFAEGMSIINYNPNCKTVLAWANKAQFKNFEKLNIPFTLVEAETQNEAATIYDGKPLQKRTASSLDFPLSFYPTYSEYAQQMQYFENEYPNLVDQFSIGRTTEGDKEILFVKISDNVNTTEQEPKLMFTSSMHGDEIAGYPMMLTLIDYILTVYSDAKHTDHTRIKNLVENTEIWINPNANPDGTYYNSPDNTSVANARRGNANNVDLNRNYPDNVVGAHPDGEAYQLETLHFMQLAEEQHFVISANFHGGQELVNYPFDNAYTSQYEHPDGDWFELVGMEYAAHANTDANNDTAAKNKPTYMTTDKDNDIFPSSGVTHGAEWYRVYGGRQDYMNYYHQCKEITIELSEEKILPESKLVDYWHYNKDALLNFLTQGTYGFKGEVKNALTEEPIEGATVTLVNHDNFGSHTITEDIFGTYYRPVKAGTYDIKIEAPFYESITLKNQTIADYQTQTLKDVMLAPVIIAKPEITIVEVEQDITAELQWSGNSNSSEIQTEKADARLERK